MYSSQVNTLSTEEKAQLFDSIFHFCTGCDSGRGIWKRIDENRELLEFLKENAPELIKRCGFIEVWLGQQDVFLNVLRSIVKPKRHPSLDSPAFPRPWKGSFPLEPIYAEFVEMYIPSKIQEEENSQRRSVYPKQYKLIKARPLSRWTKQDILISITGEQLENTLKLNCHSHLLSNLKADFLRAVCLCPTTLNPKLYSLNYAKLKKLTNEEILSWINVQNKKQKSPKQ